MSDPGAPSPRSWKLRFLGLVSMAAGWIVMLLTAFVWWPRELQDEWPGFVPFVVFLAGAGLFVLGLHLWPRAPEDPTDSH